MTPRNLHAPLDGPPGEEVFEELLQRPGLRLERIVSKGQPSPPDFWYDQADDEWVLLARGRAVLQYADASVELAAGDHLLIPAHCRHRVVEVSEDAIWLALHIGQVL